MVDLTGDGMPDVLPNTTNVVVWYEVVKKADGKGFELKKHDFGTPGRRPRRRLGRRQRRRPRRPAHAQGLVRGPGRPAHRDLGLAPRVEARRHRHPDPRPRRRRRRPLRRRLRHGPRLRPLLAQARQGRRRRADLDQADDRRRRSPRSTPCSGPTSTATARPTSWSPASASTPTRSSPARPTARSSPGISSTRRPRRGSSTSSSRASRPRTHPPRSAERLRPEGLPPRHRRHRPPDDRHRHRQRRRPRPRLPRQERALPVREPAGIEVERLQAEWLDSPGSTYRRSWLDAGPCRSASARRRVGFTRPARIRRSRFRATLTPMPRPSMY